jgi:hypothetical protein
VARGAWLVGIVVVVAVGCTPLETIERFDGEFAGARGQRRVLALASPT